MSTTPRSCKSVDTKGFALHSANNIRAGAGADAAPSDDGFPVLELKDADPAQGVRVQGIHDVPDSTASETTCVSEGHWRMPDCVSLNKHGDVPDFSQKFKAEEEEDMLRRQVEALAAKAAARHADGGGFAGDVRPPDSFVRLAAPPPKDAAATPMSEGTYNECYSALESVMAAYR